MQVQDETDGSADGAIPVRGDGSLLPTHGIYGPGVSFLEFDLGDFTLTDSPIRDYQGIPTSFPAVGQINVYEVTLTGFPSGIHFDTYDPTVTGMNGSQVKYVFRMIMVLKSLTSSLAVFSKSSRMW